MLTNYLKDTIYVNISVKASSILNQIVKDLEKELGHLIENFQNLVKDAKAK